MEYKDLDVWKKARILAKEAIIIARSLPSIENYSLAFQISKSAISIPSNIAEGCGRNTSKDTLQFLFISRGSVFELETQVFLCFDSVTLDIDQGVIETQQWIPLGTLCY